MATVSTTFTFSSTDITSDSLSFTVSEALALTGSGGIRRFNLSHATNSQSAYEVINSESFANSGIDDDIISTMASPTYLYLKNITGSGFSGSDGAAGTASYVHLYVSGAGQGVVSLKDGLRSAAIIPQGGFAYIPVNPNMSYFMYAGDHTGSEGNITASTIVEFGVFN
tara:strand:- start:444 stop:947 length:504 start_codon:yes stop_codon:yes gene_type:complete